MNPHKKRSLILSLKDALKEVEGVSVETKCADCQFHQQGFCKMWNDRIPTEILSVGCKEWVFDENSPPF